MLQETGYLGDVARIKGGFVIWERTKTPYIHCDYDCTTVASGPIVITIFFESTRHDDLEQRGMKLEALSRSTL